jgi:predicted negative regulator of RcsB-dependent stress response
LTEYLTEQEQIQQLKTWLKQYGITILVGIVVGLIATTSWHYWKSYHNKILVHASGIYDEMLELRAQNNAYGAAIQAQKLLNHYRKTPYAAIANLLLARDAVLKRNYPAAIQQLNEVIAHSHNSSLREIARIRMARILIADQKPDAALDLLKKLDDENFLGLVDETRGDAYLAKQDPTSARQAYKLALQELPNAEVTRPILEMKFTNLTPETH